MLRYNHSRPRSRVAAGFGRGHRYPVALQEPSELMQQLATLPLFPSTVIGLLAISSESPTAVEEYERAFRADPALASDLLRAANSVEFGLLERVESIRQALTLLGLDRVGTLAATVALQRYTVPLPNQQFLRPFLAHSIASAVIAEALATVRGCHSAGVYTAGLVHDVGRLGLLIGAAGYAKLCSQPLAIDAGIELEVEQCGVSHPHAGEIIAASWRFPEWICQAIRHHHDANESSDVRVRLVQRACRYASMLGFAELGERPVPPAEFPVDLRGHPLLDPGRLRQRVNHLLLAVTQSKRQS